MSQKMYELFIVLGFWCCVDLFMETLTKLDEFFFHEQNMFIKINKSILFFPHIF